MKPRTNGFLTVLRLALLNTKRVLVPSLAGLLSALRFSGFSSLLFEVQELYPPRWVSKSRV
jgi:hypothetical protein